MRIGFALAAIPVMGLLPLMAQESWQPAPVLQIFQETVKEGRGAAHAKVEADWAATFRKADFPAHYIAMATMSGPEEVWFVQPMPSFAINEEYDKASAKEPLKSALATMSSLDGELRSSSKTLWAVFRPDLSYGVERFNPPKMRFVSIGSYRVKLGRDQDFTEGTKTYLGGYAKANIETCILAYQVVAGAPAGTYLFISMMDSLQTFDQQPERMKALRDAMGDDYSKIMTGAGEVFVSIENTLFQAKPAMSYAPKALIDADPFWKPEATTVTATRTKKKEK